MIQEIKVPVVGESISEGVLVEWLQEDGAVVAVDDPLFELETDKITLTVPAEHAGKLSIKVEAESEVEVGQVVGTIDTEAAGAEASDGGTEKGADKNAEKDDKGEKDADKGEKDEKERPEPDAETGGDDEPAAEESSVDLDAFELSPAARRVVAQHGLDPARIEGTGKDGRLTKEDVQRFLDQGPAAEKAPEKKPADKPVNKPEAKPAKKPEKKARAEGERETRRPMSSLRRRLAQRLVQVQQTAAILTTFNEADMSRVMALRGQYKEAFEKKHGARLGFMSFFVKAAVEALKSVPMVNNRIDGDDIVEQHFYDIGVAVGTDAGLVVPVLRDADQLSFAEVEAQIADLAQRAQKRRLTLDDLSGGTFTISNGGVYGSLLSTPILNPPQSAILGMHSIKKRPVVVDPADDRVEVRPMMNLALSYDHRIIDGKEAVTFLRRVVECIEAPERLILEV